MALLLLGRTLTATRTVFPKSLGKKRLVPCEEFPVTGGVLCSDVAFLGFLEFHELCLIISAIFTPAKV